VDFAVVLLEMYGIVGCLIENDEFDHWYLLLVWRSDRLSDNRIAKLRAVVNEEARDYAPVDHLRLVQHAGADFEYPNVVFGMRRCATCAKSSMVAVLSSRAVVMSLD
jgi:hypothetical protein